MKLTCRETTASGRAEIRFLRAAEPRHRCGEQRAHPPVADDHGPTLETIQKTVAGRALRGHFVSFRLARHIHPGSRPAGFGTLPRRQVAEASQGRFPQPLSMRSGTLPASVKKYRQGHLSRIRVQKTQEGPPPGPSCVSFGRRFSEVAPAASGPVSVCFLTIALRGHLIHHPFSVDWPASRKISLCGWAKG